MSVDAHVRTCIWIYCVLPDVIFYSSKVKEKDSLWVFEGILNWKRGRGGGGRQELETRSYNPISLEPIPSATVV